MARWCDQNGSVVGDDIDDVASSIPDGWVVNTHWHTAATSFDPDGWEYSLGIFDMEWFSKPTSKRK
jgi:hypothetical protein